MNDQKNKETDRVDGLITIGFLTGKVSPGRPLGTRRLRHDFLAFLVRGEAEFAWAEGDAVKVVGPCVIHVPKGIPHRYDPNVGEPWRNYWMFIDAVDCERRFGEVMAPPGASPLSGECGALERAWSDLYDTVAVAGEKRGVMTNYLTHVVLTETWRATVSGEEWGGDAIVVKARRLMAERIQEPTLDCRRLARDLGMGYDNFRLRFKRLVGRSPKQCYLDMKINAARSMLSAPGSRVAETAESLGFKDPFYFSRLFKRKAGMSPKEFSLTI